MYSNGKRPTQSVFQVRFLASFFGEDYFNQERSPLARLIDEQEEPDDSNDGLSAIEGCLAAIVLWFIVMVLIAGVIKSCGIG